MSVTAARLFARQVVQSRAADEAADWQPVLFRQEDYEENLSNCSGLPRGRAREYSWAFISVH